MNLVHEGTLSLRQQETTLFKISRTICPAVFRTVEQFYRRLKLNRSNALNVAYKIV